MIVFDNKFKCRATSMGLDAVQDGAKCPCLVGICIGMLDSQAFVTSVIDLNVNTATGMKL